MRLLVRQRKILLLALLTQLYAIALQSTDMFGQNEL